MKIYYNGLNLHNQFPCAESLVENFIDFVHPRVGKIEVSYHESVLLVADTVTVQGARNGQFQIVEGEISRMVCDENKILVLLKNGELYKITDQVQKLPKFLELEDSDRIVEIASGSKLTVALTQQGNIYNNTNKLDYSNKNIVGVKTGREHCLLLDRNGDVFSFGRGSRGQLGHGSLDDEPEPRLVEALAGIKIVSISAGGWHSCALSQEGDVYTWGWNSNGQLGLREGRDISIMATPRVVDVDFNVRKIQCGNKHTVALSESGTLWGCGWNKYHQLKGEKIEDFHKMTELWDFSNENVKEIKCGPWNTLVLCEG